MPAKHTSRPNKHKGQSLVEFALLLPALLLLLFGAIDFGRLLPAKIALTNIARVGVNDPARHITDAVTGFSGTINATIPAASLPNICDPDADCNLKESDGACASGGTAVARTTIETKLIFINFLAQGDGVPLTSTVEMLAQ